MTPIANEGVVPYIFVGVIIGICIIFLFAFLGIYSFVGILAIISFALFFACFLSLVFYRLFSVIPSDKAFNKVLAFV